MKHLAAYVLVVMGGNSKPTLDDIHRVLGAAGATYDDNKLNELIKLLDGKDVNTITQTGKEMLQKQLSPPPPPPQPKPEKQRKHLDEV